MANGESHSEPSVVTALGRAIDAGQRIVVNRIDLARLDILDAVGRAAQGGVFIVLGGILLAVGWLAFTSAAIIFGQDYLTLAGSAALVGGINAAAGLLALSIGMQRVRPNSVVSNGDKE